ncbi:MAG: YqgE/AlgH family protein [Magnetococcales bacterium]|nr:YqgE/AlgH family protein [Magnetococcales bacterium]NGZ25608.1 YqgE/AlgH family protein [Magnetococcales bacterium]
MQSLAGKLLIAMPSLRDSNFHRTVIFVCAHSEEGALGLVINRPHPSSLDNVLQQLGLNWLRQDKPPLYIGGPVAPERGFILYEKPLDIPGFIQVDPNLFMGTNPDILNYLAQPSSDDRFLFALGYAGWGTGQLEGELRENSWLVSSMDRDLLFEIPPAQRWSTAIRQLGFDPAQLVAGSHSIH